MKKRMTTCAATVCIAFLALVVPLGLATTANAALVAHYNFDDDTATDLSGNDNDGTLGALTAFSTDNPFGVGNGKSANFGGDTGVIEVPTSASLNAVGAGATAKMTIALWAKFPATEPTWIRYIQQRDGVMGGDGWFLTGDGDDRIIVFDPTDSGEQNVGGAVGLTNGAKMTPYKDDAWHHIAFTMDGTHVRGYVDGVFIDNWAYTHGTGFASSGSLFIGGRSNVEGTSNTPTEGSLDDIGLWDEVLTPEYIAYLGAGDGNPIPEPATMTLLAFGGLGVLIRRRRRA